MCKNISLYHHYNVIFPSFIENIIKCNSHSEGIEIPNIIYCFQTQSSISNKKFCMFVRYWLYSNMIKKQMKPTALRLYSRVKFSRQK